MLDINLIITFTLLYVLWNYAWKTSFSLLRCADVTFETLNYYHHLLNELLASHVCRSIVMSNQRHTPMFSSLHTNISDVFDIFVILDIFDILDRLYVLPI